MNTWSETMSARADLVYRERHQRMRTTRRLIKNGVNDAETLSKEIGVKKDTIRTYLRQMGYQVKNGKVFRNGMES